MFPIYFRFSLKDSIVINFADCLLFLLKWSGWKQPNYSSLLAHFAFCFQVSQVKLSAVFFETADGWSRFLFYRICYFSMITLGPSWSIMQRRMMISSFPFIKFPFWNYQNNLKPHCLAEWNSNVWQIRNLNWSKSLWEPCEKLIHPWLLFDTSVNG